MERLRSETKLQIVGLTNEIKKTVITGIEMFRKQLDMGHGLETTQDVCSVVSTRPRLSVVRVLAKPNSITPHTKFSAHRCTSFQRKKEEDTLPSSTITDLSSLQNNGRYRYRSA